MGAIKQKPACCNMHLFLKSKDIDFEADIIAEGDFIILDVAKKLIPVPIFRSGRSSTSLLPGWLMIFLGAIWGPIIPWMEQLKARTLMEQSH